MSEQQTNEGVTSEGTLPPPQKSIPFIVIAIFTSIYMIAYGLGTIWLLFDGWINQFEALYWLWGVDNKDHFSATICFALFTVLGAIMGGSLLSITSFHRHFAIEKKFDTDHLWGYWFTPVLSIIVGIVVYALVQSGLLVLSGTSNSLDNLSTAALGYTAIGSVAGYNWDIFIRKLQDLSKLLNPKEQTNKLKES
ncbi:MULTISPECIES: hypothetical protein [Vibrio harveyi group]|uniref:hypothetical protein n=1 Tax=Vibrio harveyi group TaxID=717610 RepID=UPI001D16BAB4|nr:MULTISPECIES: hypothetical protein [Vibrio harveyi group]MCZ6298246.1 hypothetical protein [Vibrio parahaemolyticus]MCZ6375632.1 hypothetical protein [Vibrio parahaemolyticus]MDF4661379.1 hypothetical protein [Vibrio parahaemolyticus]MDG3388735.1 hypothetical protein [Vibrio parahaemolyticus]